MNHGDMIREESGVFAADGTRLHARFRGPEQPEAVVAIVHGYGEHAGRYDHFATALERCGIASVGVDLRGHGRSEGRCAHIDSFEDYLVKQKVISRAKLDAIRAEVQDDVQAGIKFAEESPMPDPATITDDVYA